MGSEPVIVAEHISKKFILNQGRAGDLRELFSGFWRKNNKVAVETSAEPFYALRDVDFVINPGETVGIVGHNGSGKSTLLKMLTGILKPDTGSIHTRGRIGALIEVGAGFHPDLSGRENIFLNGSIMGLSRHELAARFDNIVAFAGLEKFIDTPVKRYSSGMYMRLGFAIATHINPDILLIDEVLAVGDTQFQNKCLKRLHEFSAQGGTVVFVSHAMGQVAELCQRCLWLDHGKLLHNGPTADAIDKYMAVVAEREEEELLRTNPELWEARKRQIAEAEAQEKARREAEQIRLSNPKRGRILSVRLLDKNNQPRTTYEAGEILQVEFIYQYDVAPVKPVIGIDIYRDDPTEMHVFTISNYDHGIEVPNHTGESRVTLTLGPLALITGDYRVTANLFANSTAPGWSASPDDTARDVFHFHVDTPVVSPGITYMPSAWHVPQEND